LTSLVKKVDEAAVKNASARMGSYVVICKDEEGLEKKLKELAKKQDLKKVVLAIDNPAGPEGWNIAKGAGVTVVMYTKRNVKASHVFKPGELKAKDIEAILADVSKILPASKK
jgi:hypothetical protein